MSTTLMSGERLIRQHRRGLAITTHRLLLEAGGSSSVESFSAPLSEVGLCEVRLQPKHWLLALALVALVPAVFLDPAFAAGVAQTRSLARGIFTWCVAAAVPGLLYWRSWRAELSIRIGDARRVFGFPRRDLEALQEFVKAIHQARENYVSAARIAGLAPAAGHQADSGGLHRLKNSTAGMGDTRGLWRVQGSRKQ